MTSRDLIDRSIDELETWCANHTSRPNVLNGSIVPLLRIAKDGYDVKLLLQTLASHAAIHREEDLLVHLPHLPVFEALSALDKWGDIGLKSSFWHLKKALSCVFSQYSDLNLTYSTDGMGVLQNILSNISSTHQNYDPYIMCQIALSNKCRADGVIADRNPSMLHIPLYMASFLPYTLAQNIGCLLIDFGASLEQVVKGQHLRTVLLRRHPLLYDIYDQYEKDLGRSVQEKEKLGKIVSYDGTQDRLPRKI